jgi:hypothetical protein
VFAEDGATEQVHMAEATMLWTREAGVTTCSTPTEQFNDQVLIGGTLSCAWSVAVVSNDCEVSLACTSSLTTTQFIAKMGAHLFGNWVSTNWRVTIP